MEKDKKTVKKTTVNATKVVKSASKKPIKANSAKSISKPKPALKVKKVEVKVRSVKKIAAKKVEPKAVKKVKAVGEEIVASQPVVEEKGVDVVLAVAAETVSEPETKEEVFVLKNYVEAVGRRKTSVARVRLVEGKGIFLINGKQALDYFSSDKILTHALLDRPFSTLGRRNKFDVTVKVFGGGMQSQVGAVTHAISRALVNFNAEFRSSLRQAGLLTRDSRMKERRKYGLMGARKRKSSPKR